MKITAEELRERLHYDPDTGVFTRRIATGRHGCHKAGSVIGSINKKDGYLYARLGKGKGRLYSLHRLAWLYQTGEWPKEIDHINTMRSDNRFVNLRETTRTLNNANRSAPTARKKGAFYQPDRGNWRSHISVNGKLIFLGRFPTEDQAHEAYCAAAAKYFGTFARTA